MSSKGRTKQQKRLSAAKVVHVNRKASTWIASTRPGAHKKNAAVPLVVLLRDQLGLADTQKEAKYLVRKGSVVIDGRIVRDDTQAVGLFDIVSFPGVGKFYRIVFDDNGRLVPREVKKDSHKIARIDKKTAVKKGKIQITLSDGRNVLVDKNDASKYSAGDSLKISLPEQKITEHYAYETGKLVYVIKGRHTGERGVVEGVVESSLGKKGTLTVKSPEKSFKTVAENVVVVGEKSEGIEI